MLFEYIEFVLEIPVPGRAVPAVCMFGDYPQHQFLTAAADCDGRMRLLDWFGTAICFGQLIIATLKAGTLFGHQQFENLDSLVELPQPRPGRREFIAISAIFLLHPARTEADLRSPITQVVYCRQHL